MNLDITCDEASITPGGYKMLNASISGADADEILGQIKIEDVMKYFNTKEILDSIHISDVIDHYGEEALFNNMDISANFREI